MHLVETYALSCGAKIEKPFIYTTFFPLPVQQYITFHSDENENSKKYDYWQDVINIINPPLQKFGIRIIQIGGVKDREFADCLNLKGQISQNQLAYIIQRSLLHIGPDGFPLQLAGAFNVPVVGLYSCNFVDSTKPYFGKSEQHKLFSTYDRAKLKPSHSAEETPKTINLIKPEEIAQAILELLKIDFKIPFETVHIGNKYSNLTIEEAIPNSPHILFNPEHQVEIRTDLGYDENSFLQQLAAYKKTILILEQPLNLDIVRRFKNNVLSIVFKIVDNTQKEFLKQVQELGKPLVLISTLPLDKIQNLKEFYYEFGNINHIENVAEDKINELKKDVDNLYYRSAKITAYNGKYHYSLAAAKVGFPMQNHHEYQKVIDSPAFWENMNYFTVVRKK